MAGVFFFSRIFVDPAVGDDGPGTLLFSLPCHKETRKRENQLPSGSCYFFGFLNIFDVSLEELSLPSHVILCVSFKKKNERASHDYIQQIGQRAYHHFEWVNENLP